LTNRIETGPYNPPGNNWTGYFMRGDEALALAGLLRAMARSLDHNDPFVVPHIPKRLRALADDLETVKE
jgi:hypothetical protein